MKRFWHLLGKTTEEENVSEKRAVAVLINSHSAYEDKSSIKTFDTVKANFESIENSLIFSVIEIFICIPKIFI